MRQNETAECAKDNGVDLLLKITEVEPTRKTRFPSGGKNYGSMNPNVLLIWCLTKAPY